MIETRDAAEIQALIRRHASAIVEAVDDGGIKPSKRDELERTCLRMVELSQALTQCELERTAASYRKVMNGSGTFQAYDGI